MQWTLVLHRWGLHLTCSVYFAELYAILQALNYIDGQPNRRYLICRLRIGHTFLTHSHLLLGNPPESCQSCDVLLTWRHIFLECPLYMVARILFNLPDSVKSCWLSSGNIRSTLSFLKTIKLFHKV
nr:unnamed protein product [Callosobruchus analis]